MNQLLKLNILGYFLAQIIGTLASVSLTGYYLFVVLHVVNRIVFFILVL